MKIGIIGTGYVGLPTGVGFAELGNTVVCVDKNENKINDLKKGKITLYEDGLEDLFNKNVKNGRLKFTTSMKEGVADADMVILAVGTPPHPVTKEADLRFVYEAVAEIKLFPNIIRRLILMSFLCPSFYGKDLPFMIFSIRTELLSEPIPSGPKMLFASYMNRLTEKHTFCLLNAVPAKQ